MLVKAADDSHQGGNKRYYFAGMLDGPYEMEKGRTGEMTIDGTSSTLPATWHLYQFLSIETCVLYVNSFILGFIALCEKVCVCTCACRKVDRG